MNESGFCLSACLTGGWNEGVEGVGSSNAKFEPPTE